MNRTFINADAWRRGVRNLVISLCVLSVCAVGAVLPARAADAPKITIVADLAWLRNSPSLVAGNSLPVTKGQFYDVLSRTTDGAWWQLAVPDTPASKGTWLLAELGAIYSGNPNDAPVVSLPTAVATGATKKARQAKEAPLPTWIPKITPQQRAIWQNAARAGKDVNMFTVVGDCNSQPAVYLQRLASGQFDASMLSPRLQSVVQQFGGSFGRISLAAKGGFGSASMMDPSWADGALCDAKSGMGPFACELWVSRASIVFISLGTQEQYDWKNFEKNFRPMIEHAKVIGVLPVLVTKADDIETAAGAPTGYINDIVRKLAAEYGVPLLDFHAAARALPNGGLIDEGDKDFHQSYAGMDTRILATLQTLVAITGK
jgi:hypothetical protein